MRQRGQREAAILARTFHDRLWAERTKWTRDESGESVEVREVVYDELPCALSRSANNKPERMEQHSEASREHVLFTAPGAELFDNDRVTVVTEAGQTYTGITGRTFAYISHGETPFAAERIA